MDFYTVNLVNVEVASRNQSEFLNEKFNHTAGAVFAFKPKNIDVSRQVFFDLNIGKLFNLESSEAISKCNGKRYHRMTTQVEQEMRMAMEYPYLTSQKREKMNSVLEMLKEIGEL